MASSKGHSDVPPSSPFSDLPEVVPEDYLPSYEAATRNDLLRQTTAVRGNTRNPRTLFWVDKTHHISR